MFIIDPKLHAQMYNERDDAEEAIRRFESGNLDNETICMLVAATRRYLDMVQAHYFDIFEPKVSRNYIINQI